MNKYDVRFCSCGTIHVMPVSYYDWMENDYKNRSVYRVCQRCGRTIRTWLSEYDDGFCVNSCEMNDFELSKENKDDFKVIFSKGIRVPLKTGNYATYHSCGNAWFDEDKKSDVDTKRLIHEVKDEEILKSISGYVTGIDWSDTPYEIKY